MTFFLKSFTRKGDDLFKMSRKQRNSILNDSELDSKQDSEEDDTVKHMLNLISKEDDEGDYSK